MWAVMLGLEYSQQNNAKLDQQKLRGDMFDLKITLPRLKVASTSSISHVYKHCNTPKTDITSQPHSPRQAKTLEQTLNTLKYHYVNKSPHYYRSRNKSVQSSKLLKETDKSIEQFIGEHSRMLDKQLLMNQAKQRSYRLQNYESLKSIPEDPQKSRITLKVNPILQPQPKDPALKTTKYEFFRPLRFPLHHNIKYLAHPDLRIKSTIE